MAKKIIILNKQNQTNYFEIQYVFWLDVPVNQQVLSANADAVSSFPGATIDEINALKNGLVKEVTGVASFVTGTTAAVIKAELISKFNEAQNSVSSNTKFNYYGTFYDGSVWTINGV